MHREESENPYMLTAYTRDCDLCQSIFYGKILNGELYYLFNKKAEK